jgi:nucleoside-diphosphate-sugar epimerase
VFLTGATGNWGRCVLREFAERADRFDVVALVLPTRRDRRVIAEHAGMPNLDVVYGDLTDYAAVESCVRGADYVLHVGALVSPAADDYPELAWQVNVGSARNIVQAVLAQPDPGAISVVGVGSVAETGDRPPPVHWGRVGDPLRASKYDVYGQSKIAAERVVVDSGLPRWAWLRQTAIFHPGVLETRDAIMTHVPLGGVMEWVSVADSARLLANVCEGEMPAEFWGGVYNIGGGAGWQLTNWEFQTRLMAALGVQDVRRWYDRNWFATRNFHGQWYTDSDRLEKLVPFRQDTFVSALARAVRAAPASVRMAGRWPAALVRHSVIKPLTRQPRGTMAFIRGNDEAKISAYFGSRAEWECIGDWSTFTPPQPGLTPRLLDHGYDESREPVRWTRNDLAGTANFRGGVLLSPMPRPGDVTTPLLWRCAEGHEFPGSPRLILSAGHWCPECVKDPARYADQAVANRFLAQVEDAYPGAEWRRRPGSFGPLRERNPAPPSA